MYSREIRHDGLNKFRVIRGKSLYEVDQKAEMQLRVWEDQWNRVVKRHEESLLKSNKRATAQQLSDQLKKERQLAEEYLILTIKSNKTVDLRTDLQRRTFDAEEPIAPELESIRQMPDPKAKVYQPIYNIIEQILPFLATNKKEEARKRYDREHRIWMNEKEEIESRNEGKWNEYQSNYLKWKNDKESFEKNEKERLEFLESVFDNYRTQKEGSIEGYFDYLLNRFTLLDYIPIQRNMKYLIDTKTLYIEQYLPSIEELPSIKEIKYVVEGDEFVEIPLSNKFLNEFYDRLIYSLILSYLHLIFSNDKRNKIDSIAFNGYVDTINKGTGNSETPCIASIFVSREEFESINLEFVNPKTCFKQLKGVGSSKLHTLTSVPPVIKMDWDDDRIIDGKETLSQMDDTTNLAAMDWQDFEHLIREVFEREFSKNGGEVKITQASRDGGVDAIAFDPDPLRGGKIVIQAKRYTNTVGVAAVRDLYGTVMNEGAIKGILVSTADYGPDAYNFAKDKPLTLLNGSNLLYLLENHGHKAVIDLKAAKEGRRLNE
ncbi:restriction endonuclease [Exiguobacterium sp. BG5(2022)]|uniref:restriction endonuclease n=1 Tax=Exiguobacterium sp. BG5(2022) TaxID=2962595 RepID=UPI0028813985|nr:restriction endonuclease [Exiguobacterium sp. BG5(2022)]MDT0193499.1 restriction endonuclease [Exiguobacterium sp. BG5(2022)]